MESSDITAEIRMAVLGEWVPPQLADVLALQRTEEPETHAVRPAGQIPVEARSCRATASTSPCLRLPGSGSAGYASRCGMTRWRSPWPSAPTCWPTVKCRAEVLKQPLICSQSTADEPWRMTVQRVFENALQEREQTVETFDVAMTLVAAGYGIAIAPAARLASYLRRGIAVRPLAGAPTIVMAYLLRRDASLSDTQARFARRARLVS